MQSVSAVSTDTDVGNAQILITMLTSSLDSRHSSLENSSLDITRHSSLITRRSSLDVTRHSTFVRKEQHQQERTHIARTQASSVDIQRLRQCPLRTQTRRQYTSTRQDKTGLTHQTTHDTLVPRQYFCCSAIHTGAPQLNSREKRANSNVSTQVCQPVKAGQSHADRI